MGRKHVARKVKWGITPVSNVLFERTLDCWRVVRDFQTIHHRVNGRWVLDIIPIGREALGCRRNMWLNLDRDMIRIDDDMRIDTLLNPNSDTLQDRMSSSDEIKVTVPEVVKIQSDDSSSTSASGPSSSESGETGCEALVSGEGGVYGREGEVDVMERDVPSTVPLVAPLTSIPIAAQAPAQPSTLFASLTILVATLTNPNVPTTSYAGLV